MKSSVAALVLILGSLHAVGENLQVELDEMKTSFEKRASAEKISEYDKGIKAVQDSGILSTALNVGDKAPDFTLGNALGKEITLSDLLKDGPVVLTWYRGSWCPYCNIAIRNYQENLPKFKAAGARFVAITPELPDKSLPTTEKYKLEYEVLSDVDSKVAQQFGIVFKMTEWVEGAMRDLADLKKYNGENYDDTTLPLSATYVIQPDRTISYAFLDAEYRNRATPEQVLESLAKTNPPK